MSQFRSPTRKWSKSEVKVRGKRSRLDARSSA